MNWIEKSKQWADRTAGSFRRPTAEERFRLDLHPGDRPGVQGERMAARYLIDAGCRLLAQNERNFAGEIDLICWEPSSVKRSLRQRFRQWATWDNLFGPEPSPAQQRHRERQRLATAGTLLFVEVKTWTREEIGYDPSEAVDDHKQRQVTRAALAYLRSHRFIDFRIRFDVVSVVLITADGQPRIRHLKAAFEAVHDGMI